MWRIAILIGIALAAIIGALLSDPVTQDPAYHQFADQRAIWGIPHFFNVATNVLFIVAGVYGLWAWRKANWLEPSDRWPWLVTALGAVMIGFGSGFYHYAPDNRTLFWDRLPMTLVFMGIFTAAIVERIHARIGILLLAPFLLLGMLSVEVWRRGELIGVGDLRFYALVQFYPMVALPLMMWMFPTRYTHGRAMWVMAVLYLLAKILEFADAPIYTWTGISGHPLKHVAAACGLWAVFRVLPLRERNSIKAGVPSPPLAEKV